MTDATPSSTGSAARTRLLVGEGALLAPTTEPAGTRQERTAARSVAGRLGIGRRVGSYRLCLQIGSGGMATVFLASRLLRGGQRDYVALKCLHPALAADPEFVQMLEDEASVLARIRHPNVCGFLDWGVHDGIYFVALPFLAGETMRTIRSRLGRGALADPTWHACLVARMIADAAEGLHAAHELRDAAGGLLHVVHRDVSPENLLVTYDGNVVVMDFGLVRVRGQHHHRTRTGVLKGKLAYMQPEVVGGSRPDRRADVWSLGVVMWEMLTRRRLFRREEDAATLQAVSAAPIRPPSELSPGLPPELDAIVLRALEREPSRRWETTRDLARALNRFMGDRGCAVGPADLADVLEDLFPGGEACARQSLAIAAQIDASHAALTEDVPRPILSALLPRTRSRAAPIRRNKGAMRIVLGSVAVALLLIGTAAALAARQQVDPPRSDPAPRAEGVGGPFDPAAITRSRPLAEIPLRDASLAIEVRQVAAPEGRGVVLRMDVVPTDLPVPPARAP